MSQARCRALAATCGRQGRDADARTVLVAKHRGMRPSLKPPARLWSLLQDATVGYGYRPLRAVLLLLGLLTLGTALFTASPPTTVGDGQAPHFQPAIYTLDLLLPGPGPGTLLRARWVPCNGLPSHWSVPAGSSRPRSRPARDECCAAPRWGGRRREPRAGVGPGVTSLPRAGRRTPARRSRPRARRMTGTTRRGGAEPGRIRVRRAAGER